MRHSLFLLLFSLLFMGAGSKEEIELVKISTQLGDIYVYLYDATPGHKANFLKLTREGFFNGTTFHRVIKNFVVQGGDPYSKDSDTTNDGNGGPIYTGAQGTFPDPENKSAYCIPAEIKPDIYHKRGVFAAARSSDDINPEKRSSGSQFYIVLGKVFTPAKLDSYAVARKLTLNERQREIYTTVGGTPHLDGKYTVFGEVVSGMDVAEKIADQAKNALDRPLKDIPMKVEIIRIKASKLKKYGMRVEELQAR
jgi:cyclophilin family peptidyl-prolyl cis-trans isomerase